MSISPKFPLPLEPGYRPGERMVAGRPYIFNLDLLNAYLADAAMRLAPDDLSTLTWDELSALHSCWLINFHTLGADPWVDDFGSRVCAERARRPEYACFRGGRA